ncbi:hypothetical protein [Clostridium celatum]|uniref:hypothetical protein n=1 Tax=Clostridium celatum TaxID=36834 RepID=UPI0018995694|nr:hypothetical protein [Clostridium celatum]
MKAIDRIGQVYGKLTITGLIYNEKAKRNYALCKCECGNEKVVSISNLIKGATTSCGCYRNQRIKETCEKHGMYKTRLNKEYRGLKQRCYNSKNSRYKYYGGKNIKICDEWLGKDGFINFMNWSLENGYNDELTLDRIDVDSDYSPDNCRWVTMRIQCNNRTTSHFETFNGETKTVAEWADKVGIKASIIYKRLKRGWSIEKALTTPPMNNKK